MPGTGGKLGFDTFYLYSIKLSYKSIKFAVFVGSLYLENKNIFFSRSVSDISHVVIPKQVFLLTISAHIF